MPKEAGTNRFSALASDSDSEIEICQPEPEFRTWVIHEQSRFQSDEIKKNIFSSPFSKSKKTSKQWSRPRFREDDDGWTSIRWNQPQFQDDEAPVIYEARIVTAEENLTNMTAVAWAERIKKSLEKAELSRKTRTDNFKEALGTLSFFRKPVDTE